MHRSDSHGPELARRAGRYRAVVPPGLIPDGDGTRTTLGAWDLCDLMDQLDQIYPDGSGGTAG